MRLPQKLEGAGRERRIRYAIDRFIRKYHFDPDKRYNLLVREPHQVPDSYPEFRRHPGDGLLKRNEHWERVRPNRKIRFPLKRDAGRGRISLNQMNTAEDFIRYFNDNFSDLPDGVYGIVHRAGKSHGYNTMFVLLFREGEVAKFQSKSRSQKGAGVGESSTYFGFPWYFHIQDRIGITSADS